MHDGEPVDHSDLACLLRTFAVEVRLSGGRFYEDPND